MLNRYYPAIDDPNSAWKNYVNSQANLDEINSSLIKMILYKRQPMQATSMLLHPN